MKSNNMLWLVLCLCVLTGCEKKELTSGKESTVRFAATTIEGNDLSSSSLSRLRIVALDETPAVFRIFSFDPGELTSGECSVVLPIGRYTLAFIANGEGDAEVSCDIGDTPGDIAMKLVKSGDNYLAASDFLTATGSVHLTRDNTPAPLAIDLERRIGKIRLDLTELPNTIDSMKLELRQAPTTLTFEGKTSGTATIIADMEFQPGGNTASGEVLSFPLAENKGEIGVLYTIDQVTYRGSLGLSPALSANRVISVSGSYTPSETQPARFTITDWEGEVIDGGHFLISDSDEIVRDDRPITGSPSGSNLIGNGGFETWESSPLHPSGWVFDNAGTHATVTRNTHTDYLLQGSASARLEQSTYLYQNVPVTEGACYQIRLKVNANTSAYKWKVNCTWRKSAAASSSGLLSTAYNSLIQTGQLGATEGWVEPFGENNRFRAPYGAKFLRIEVRTYSIGNNVLADDEGIFLDDLEVYLLQ